MKTEERLRTHSERRHSRHLLADRGGAVLVLVAFGLVVFLGMAALAIDIGLLYVARSEAQRAADAAAHAGAGFYQINRARPDAVEATRAFTVAFAENNDVRGQPVRLDGASDVDVLPDEGLVRVRVRRTDDGIDGPIPTLFARALGFREVEVSASAAAQIFAARAAGCMLPVALPDRWARDDGSFPDPWEPYNSPPVSTDFYDENETGYRLPDDLGAVLVMRPPTGQGQGNDGTRITPSWWSSINSSEFNFSGEGPADIRPAIVGCDGEPFGPGDLVDQSSGNMADLRRSWESLVESDAAEWNTTLGCVTDIDGTECRTSPRLRPMVLFSPDLEVEGPNARIAVTRIVGVFVESVEGRGANYDVILRLASFPSGLPGDDVAGPGDFVTAIRIVE